MTDEFVIAIKYHCGTVEHCWAVTKIHSWWLCIEKPGGAKPGKLFDQGARFFVEDTAAEHNLAKDIQRVLLHTMLICSPVHFWWTTSCSLVTRQQDCPHLSSDSSMTSLTPVAINARSRTSSGLGVQPLPPAFPSASTGKSLKKTSLADGTWSLQYVAILLTDWALAKQKGKELLTGSRPRAGVQSNKWSAQMTKCHENMNLYHSRKFNAFQPQHPFSIFLLSIAIRAAVPEGQHRLPHPPTGGFHRRTATKEDQHPVWRRQILAALGFPWLTTAFCALSV